MNTFKSNLTRSAEMLKMLRWEKRRQERHLKESHLRGKLWRKGRCTVIIRELVLWKEVETFITWLFPILMSHNTTKQCQFHIHSPYWFETWVMSHLPLRKAHKNTIPESRSHATHQVVEWLEVEPNFKGTVKLCTNKMKISCKELSHEVITKTLRSLISWNLKSNRKTRCCFWRLKPLKILKNS